MAQGNGNTTTTLVGLFLIVGSSVALYEGLMPWWAALGCDGLGIYFLMPNHMTGAGDFFMDMYARFRSGGVEAKIEAALGDEMETLKEEDEGIEDGNH